MENKPNNEISELLARLQQKVEKKSEPKTDSVKPKEEESTEALLSLLKKNIGVCEEGSTPTGNEEYNIQGYELEKEEPASEIEEEKIENAGETSTPEALEEDNLYSKEVEEALHNRVTELVNDSLAVEGSLELPVYAESTEEDQDLPVVLNTVAPNIDENETFCGKPGCNEGLFFSENAQSEMSDESSSDVNEDFSNEEEVEVFKEAAFAEEILEIPEVEPSADVNEETAVEEVLWEKATEEIEAQVIETTEETIFAAFGEESAKNCLHESMAKRFFDEKNSENAIFSENECLDASDFDDVDINLALALGSREALEDSVGYFRVRSAKNGFYDPFWEEATANNTYGYCGEEFRSYEQVDTIKQRYASERCRLKKQFVFTFLLSVVILFLEHLPLTPLKIPYFSEWIALPIFYYGLAVLLSCLLILVSLKKILRGVRSLLLLRAEPFVSVSCLAVLNFLYTLAIFLFARQGNLPVYNFAIAIFLLLGIADDGMRLAREKLAFDVVSEPKTKLSLERFEGNVEVDSANAFSSKTDFFVEKVDFVGNFFTRSGRRPIQLSEYFHELAFSVLGALLISLVSLSLGQGVSSALTLFVFSVFVCIPMQFLTMGIYPFFHLTKGLSKLDSAVIGDAMTDEYNDADTIYLEDTEMFGKHGAHIVGLRVYNDMDFYEILSYALSVFTVVGAPLCNVFDNSVKEIEKKEGVKITNISVGGLEASVENEKTVYIGNLAFMRSRGYFPKRNPDDEKKIESGQISILYMAIGGELCAKIYMQYTVTQRFEKFAAEMIRNGIHVGIRTLDPNVNEKMIAALRNDDEISIKVIRPTPNELIPIGKHSDSGIVTSKNSHMIFKILEQCFNIKRIHSVQKKLRLGALLLGITVSSIFMVLRLYTSVPSLYIVIYQLLWFLPAWIYTKTKLK